MAESATMGNLPFLWEGTDRNGKKIKGKSTAADEAAVRADLRRQGVVPSRIKKQTKGLFSGGGMAPTHVGSFFLTDPYRGQDGSMGKGWLIHEERTELDLP